MFKKIIIIIIELNGEIINLLMMVNYPVKEILNVPYN